MEASREGTVLLILIWVLTALSFIVVSLRVVAKLRISQFRLDDLLMISALILAIVAAVFNTIAVHYGYGYSEVPEPYATLVRKNYIIGDNILIVSAAFGRAAFIVYILAILSGQKWLRVIFISLAVLEVIINLAMIIIIFDNCNPPASLWDYTIVGTCLPADIQLGYAYFQSIFNIFVDLYLAVVPTYIFWNLNLKVAIKLSLIGLMSCGLVAMAAAIVKTVQLSEIENYASGDTVKLVSAGYLEAHLVIITASVPCLRSLILSGFRYVNSSGQSRSYELGAAYTGTQRGTATVTAHNNDHHQKTTVLSNRDNADDGASTHYILESCNSIDAAQSSDSGQDLHTRSIGIQKQVDVNVTIQTHSPKG